MTVGSYSRPKWRSLYFIGAGFSLAAAIFRALLPESEQFIRAREETRASGVQMTSGEAARHFFREVGHMLRRNWIRCIWAICVSLRHTQRRASLMTDHDWHELLLARLAGPLVSTPISIALTYSPTYLKKTKGLSTHQESIAVIISK